MSAAGGRPASRFGVAGVLGLGQLAGRGVLALYFVFLIRQLTEAEYGDLAYALSWLTILVVIADGGFARLLLKDAAHPGVGRASLAAALLGVRTAWAVTTAAVGAVVLALVGLPFGTWFAAVLIAAILLEAGSLGFEALAQAADRPWAASVAQIAGAAVLLVWMGISLAVTFTPLLGLVGIAVASATRLAVQGSFWMRRASRVKLWPGRSRALVALRRALPFFLLAGLAALYYRLDVLILYLERGATETAPYAAAYRVVDGVVIAGGVLFTALAPHFSRLHASKPALVWPEWKRYALRVGGAGLLVAGAIALLADPISALLFGERYEESAGESLRLLAPGIAFMLLQTVNAAVVLMTDRWRAVLALSVANLLLNLAVTYVLVVSSGATGASIATSVAEIVTFLGFALMVAARHRRAATNAAQPA